MEREGNGRGRKKKDREGMGKKRKRREENREEPHAVACLFLPCLFNLCLQYAGSQIL